MNIKQAEAMARDVRLWLDTCYTVGVERVGDVWAVLVIHQCADKSMYLLKRAPADAWLVWHIRYVVD